MTSRKALILLLCLLWPVAPAFSAKCTDAYIHAQAAYKQAKKGYMSRKLEAAQDFAKLAMAEAENAIDAAEACKCEDAEKAAKDAHENARKAIRTEDYYVAVRYLRLVKTGMDRVMSEVGLCG